MAIFLRAFCVLLLCLNSAKSDENWTAGKQKSRAFLLLHSDISALQSNIISQTTVTTSLDCAFLCSAHQHCKAFNFRTRKHSKDLNCQLTSTDEHRFEKSKEHSSAPRWMFYRPAPKRQISDANASQACANEDEVLVNSNNGTLRDQLSASTILSGEPLTFIEHLESWLPVYAVEGGIWSVCWRAGRDGWSAATFHAGCDDKGPTLVVVKVATYVFGGYTKASWKADRITGYEHKMAPGSFLFSLRNKDDIEPFKAELLDDNDPTAITADASTGPRFGFFRDLEISDNANANNDSSTRGFGRSYHAPEDYGYLRPETLSLLAGTSYFSPSEIEVFYVQLPEEFQAGH